MKTIDRRKGQRPRTIQRLEFIRRNLDKSDTEIARMLGVHRSAVHQLRHRFKIAKGHAAVERKQRRIEQVRRLKPGLSAKAAAAQLGITLNRVKHYGKQTGYEFLGMPAARHFQWRQRLKSLPPLLTITAVARELGVTYGHAALLCYRHKYKVRVRGRKNPPRVPIRRWVMRPDHERWLASLKPVKP
jgi:DNA-binding CsgD family transcriptional regulator